MVGCPGAVGSPSHAIGLGLAGRGCSGSKGTQGWVCLRGDAQAVMGTWCPPRADAVWQGGGKCSGSEGDPASPWGQLGGNAPAVRGTLCVLLG